VPAQYKRFQAGVQHLLQEGALQAFQYMDPARNIPMLGAVGSLQFEVFKYRLENEYGAVVRMEPSTSTVIRWVDPEGPEVSEEMLPPGGKLMFDTSRRKVLLFDTEWVLKFFSDKHPDVLLRKLPAAIRRNR